ncbi:unnamed protein product [Caretta caretta]
MALKKSAPETVCTGDGMVSENEETPQQEDAEQIEPHGMLSGNVKGAEAVQEPSEGTDLRLWEREIV